MKVVFKKLLWLVCLLYVIPSYSKVYDYLPNDLKPVNLQDYLKVYVDTSGKLGFSEIKEVNFVKRQKENYGHTNYAIWYQFEVYNNSRDQLFLQINPEWLPELEVYKVDDFGNFNFKKRGGTQCPNKRKDIVSNLNVFDLELVEEEKAVFVVKVYGDHIIAPNFTLGKRSSIVHTSRREDQVYFMYIGVMILLLIYGLLLGRVVKERSYVYYSCYLFFMALSVLFRKGYLNEWWNMFWLSNHQSIFSSLTVVFITLSIGAVTQTAFYFPILNRVKKAIIVIALISIGINALGGVKLANELTSLVLILNALWGIAIGVNVIKDGTITSRLIFVGYASFLVGGGIYTLEINGLLPYSWVAANAFLLGSWVEVIVFSISFGLNMVNMKKDKFDAQNRALELVKKNKELILEQKEELEFKVKSRTKELNEANEELQATLTTIHEQKKQLEIHSKKVSDSINYSKKIQDALLPDKEVLESCGLDIDIFYKPKDILSGDFYWFGEKGDYLYLAVADCTGHGVPGAMLSISGHSLLNRIVFEEKYREVDEILNRLHVELIEFLHAEKTDTQDGMDIQLIRFCKNTEEVCFAGAKNPIYYTDIDNVLHKVNADRWSIGGTQHFGLPSFTKKIIPEDWGNIFLFSDGFQDQFGHANNKKFMVGNFKRFLQQVSSFSTDVQMDKISHQFSEWKGDCTQTDDVLVVTLKKGVFAEDVYCNQEKGELVYN